MSEYYCCYLKKFILLNKLTLSFNSVKAENHLLLLDGTQHSCDSPVTVDTADTSTLTCSVDSKPQANFTWSSQPGLTTSLVGSTACNQQSDKVYHCTNTLTLQNSVIPTSGVTVTCHVEAFGNTTNLCMKLGEFLLFLFSTTMMSNTIIHSVRLMPSVYFYRLMLLNVDKINCVLVNISY